MGAFSINERHNIFVVRLEICITYDTLYSKVSTKAMQELNGS